MAHHDIALPLCNWSLSERSGHEPVGNINCIGRE
jgi:hypothetical protein